MNSGPRDVAQIRFANALMLFDEFVQATVKSPDAATLRGLEGRFAERLEIQPSYWSQIKSRSRQIGERLARQFEQLSKKPVGWMDEPHQVANDPRGGAQNPVGRLPPAWQSQQPDDQHRVPQDDDERFIVGLVLSYYRRHPQRARERLLGLLGEVLTPPVQTAKSTTQSGDPNVSADEGAVGDDLWQRTRAAVKPLKGRS